MKKSIVSFLVLLALGFLVGAHLVVNNGPRVTVGMTEEEINQVLESFPGSRWARLDLDDGIQAKGKTWVTKNAIFQIAFGPDGRSTEVHITERQPSFWHQLREWIGGGEDIEDIVDDW